MIDYTRKMRSLDSALIETIWTDLEDETEPLTKEQVLAILASVKEQIELWEPEA